MLLNTYLDMYMSIMNVLRQILSHTATLSYTARLGNTLAPTPSMGLELALRLAERNCDNLVQV